MELFSRLRLWHENRKLRAMQRMLCHEIGFDMDRLAAPERILKHVDSGITAPMVAMPFPRNQREAEEIASFSAQAGIQLGLEEVALAVCERPRIVFMSPPVIRRLLEDRAACSMLEISSSPSWNTVLWLLFKQGFKVARVDPTSTQNFILLFQK